MRNAEPFRLNGTVNPVEEPYPFLDQLHGVLCCIELALEDDEGVPARNLQILRSAVQGAQTLAFLVGQSLRVMNDGRESRHA